jgi:hypothetical protein
VTILDAGMSGNCEFPLLKKKSVVEEKITIFILLNLIYNQQFKPDCTTVYFPMSDTFQLATYPSFNTRQYEFLKYNVSQIRSCSGDLYKRTCEIGKLLRRDCKIRFIFCIYSFYFNPMQLLHSSSITKYKKKQKQMYIMAIGNTAATPKLFYTLVLKKH